MSDGMVILFANEPRTYRDAQAGFIQASRPQFDVFPIAPEDVNTETARLAPHLVFCSTLTEVILQHAFAWVLLYPDNANLAVVCINGDWRVIQQVSRDDLMIIIDETAERCGVQSASTVAAGNQQALSQSDV